ncbi:MAG: glycosyltransferase, partial [Segetibacter sp.]
KFYSMETRGLPNILMISDEVPESGGNAGAVVLYRLLKHYPSDKILVIGPEQRKNSKFLNCRYEAFKTVYIRLFKSRFDKLVRSLTAFDVIPKKEFSSFLKGFQPDVVLSVMQEQFHFNQAYHYAKKKALPFALIVHDDPEIFGKVYELARGKKKELNRKIYCYASKRLCVSSEMAQYLEKLYGVPGDVLFPNPSEDIIPRSLEESSILKNPPYLTIGYAGSLTYGGYADRLEQLIPALKKTQTKLNIYSSHIKEWFGDETVNYRGSGSTPEITWQKVKNECDVVILPYSFANYPELKLYWTHFPSKLPEYLSLQMPVLITGPNYATGVKWGNNNKHAAIVVSNDSENALIEVINELKSSSEKRMQLAKNALEARNAQFNPHSIQRKFYSYMAECCKQ